MTIQLAHTVNLMMVATDGRQTYKAANVRMDAYAAIIIIALVNTLAILARDMAASLLFHYDVFFGPGWLADLGLIASAVFQLIKVGGHNVYF